MAYSPTQRTFVYEFNVRRTEDTQGNFVGIVNLGARHEFKVRDETVFDKAPVELLGIWRNKREVVANTDFLVVVCVFICLLTFARRSSQERAPTPNRSMSFRSTRGFNVRRIHRTWTPRW